MKPRILSLRSWYYVQSPTSQYFLQSQRLYLQRRHSMFCQRRHVHAPADDPYFHSIVDNPPTLVKSGQKHGYGLIILGIVFELLSTTALSY